MLRQIRQTLCIFSYKCVGQTYAWTFAFPILLRINAENPNIFKYAVYVKGFETPIADNFFFFKIPFARACQWAQMIVQPPLISVYRPCLKRDRNP